MSSSVRSLLGTKLNGVEGQSGDDGRGMGQPRRSFGSERTICRKSSSGCRVIPASGERPSGTTTPGGCSRVFRMQDISFLKSSLPIMLILKSRFSRICSAQAPLKSGVTARRDLTSSLVALRAASPASRSLPPSRNSFDQL